jgi:hypothetical protein
VSGCVPPSSAAATANPPRERPSGLGHLRLARILIAAYKGSDAEQRAKLVELTGDDDGPTVILPVLAADITPIAELSGDPPTTSSTSDLPPAR